MKGFVHIIPGFASGQKRLYERYRSGIDEEALAGLTFKVLRRLLLSNASQHLGTPRQMQTLRHLSDAEVSLTVSVVVVAVITLLVIR